MPETSKTCAGGHGISGDAMRRRRPERERAGVDRRGAGVTEIAASTQHAGCRFLHDPRVAAFAVIAATDVQVDAARLHLNVLNGN
jgi:hypothetical protein